VDSAKPRKPVPCSHQQTPALPPISFLFSFSSFPLFGIELHRPATATFDSLQRYFDSLVPFCLFFCLFTAPFFRNAYVSNYRRRLSRRPTAHASRKGFWLPVQDSGPGAYTHVRTPALTCYRAFFGGAPEGHHQESD
jgi:hypothetical protein